MEQLDQESNRNVELARAQTTEEGQVVTSLMEQLAALRIELAEKNRLIQANSTASDHLQQYVSHLEIANE
jgi:hypothetical protein